MRPLVGILCILGLSFLLTINLLSLNCQADDNNAATISSQVTARAKFTLPKLFDFERYKALFSKRYGSLIEQAARARLFLGRAFRAFVSAISYKQRKTSFYLAINQMSDWTPDEIRKIDLRPGSTKEIFGTDDDLFKPDRVAQADEPLPVASLNEVESALGDLVSREPVVQLLADVGGKRRDLEPVAGRQISLNDLAREPVHKASDTSQLIESNNPQYAPPELMSSGCSGQGSSMEPLSSQVAKLLTNIPGKNLISWATNKVSGTNNGENEKRKATTYRRRKPAVHMSQPDEIFIDHRDECMFEPRSQGRCGSCYAFSTIAVFEWLYCKATGIKVAFSEQYIIDCGDAEFGLYGCAGGQTIRVPDFIRKNGLELRANYPYRERADRCPYDKSTPDNTRGYLRVSTRSVKEIHVSQFERELKHSPMVIPVLVSDAFHEYGGGVHDGADCDQNRGHAMVLVGSGREDNEEYWLIRNSYSVNYGEGGYYKLSKKASHCIEDQVAYLFTQFTGFEKKRGVNQKHETTAVKRRYHQYVTLETSPLVTP